MSAVNVNHRWSIAEEQAARRLIDLAWEEDLGTIGDRTSQLLIPDGLKGQAVFQARSSGVLAGLPMIPLLLERLAPTLAWQPLLVDGQKLDPGSQIGILAGSMRAILALERIALNFLQRLSGIASLTYQYVEAVSGYSCQVLDTRKTTPGWRLLEKYAVRQGGGVNHRMGLYDGILIKDNHLASIGSDQNAVTVAIRKVRSLTPPIDLPIEIEVDTLEQLDCALVEKVDIVLLDNMPLDHLAEAVRRRNQLSPQTQLEASGGVNLRSIRAIAATGVDRISVGALTHSAVALDIGLDYL